MGEIEIAVSVNHTDGYLGGVSWRQEAPLMVVINRAR